MNNTLTAPEKRPYRVPRNNGADIRFTGELLAFASSRKTGSTRWSELNLYRTEAGALICEEIGRSTAKGESDLRQAEVAMSDDDVVEFFGDGWLAKKLYAQAGIDGTVHVA